MGCCAERQVRAERLKSETEESEVGKGANIRSSGTMLAELSYYYTKILEGKADEIKEFVLIDRGLKDKSIEVFCPLVKKLKNLREMQLVNNSLNLEKTENITKCFHNLPLLETLNISHNSLGKGGLEPVILNLKHLPSLKNLNLSANFIDDSHLDLLRKVVNGESGQGLVFFDLRENLLELEGLISLLEATLKFRYIKTLLLQSDHITDNQIADLKQLAPSLILEED